MTFSLKKPLQKVTEFTKCEKYCIFPIIKNATFNEASEVASYAMKPKNMEYGETIHSVLEVIVLVLHFFL